jgi:hypothetical protein
MVFKSKPHVELDIPTYREISRVEAMHDYLHSPVECHPTMLAKKYKVHTELVSTWIKEGEWVACRAKVQQSKFKQKLDACNIKDPNELTLIVYKQIVELGHSLIEIQQRSEEKKSVSGINKLIETYTKLMQIDRSCRLTLGIVGKE